jgi:hypothetical protein
MGGRDDPAGVLRARQLVATDDADRVTVVAV